MLVEGPFNLQIIESDGNRELHISFRDEYQDLVVEERATQMKQHINDLIAFYNASNDEAEKQGVQMIIQVATQLLPLIEADEVSMEDPVVLELGTASSMSKLIDEASFH